MKYKKIYRELRKNKIRISGNNRNFKGTDDKT